MPASLLRDWQEYEVLEPFGAWRDNFHAGVIASVIGNGNRNPSKQPTPYKPSDFFYMDSQSQQEHADAEMIDALRARSKTRTQVNARRKPRRRK